MPSTPPLGPSLREQIIVQFVRALETMKTSGYATEIEKAFRYARYPAKNSAYLPYACVLDLDEDHGLGEEGAPWGHYQNQMEVHVWACVAGPPRTDDELSTVLNRALDDVKHTTLNRAQLQGGNTPNTLVEFCRLRRNTRVLFEENSGVGMMILTFLVQYTHAELEPDQAIAGG